MMKKLLILFALTWTIGVNTSASTIDFEGINEFTLAAEDYGLAGDHGGYYTSGNGLFFGYHETTPYDYWGGFAASNRTVIGGDDTFHQYTSMPGTDHTVGAGGTYAIGYDDWATGVGSLINFAEIQDVKGAWFTNLAWTYEYMDEYYDEDDFYRLVVTAFDENMESIGSRSINLTGVTDWQHYNMNFEDVYALGITMSTSDDWTPYYFCMDDISTVPEPSVIVLTATSLAMFISIRRKKR